MARANGFGWKLGDVIGAQIVSVPMRVALDRASEAFKVYLGGLAAVFIVMIVLLNLLLHFVIVQPIRTDLGDRQRDQPGQHGGTGIRGARARRDRLARQNRSIACAAAWPMR